MSRHELHARSRALVTRWYEEACHSFGLDREFEVNLEALGERDATFSRPWIDQHDQRKVVAELLTNHLTYVEEITKAADAICHHEFSLFGKVVRYGDRIAWQADPLSGKPWPRDFHTRVRIFGGNSGNDIIRGGGGSDRIQGDSGKDVLEGEGGDDWIWARDGQHDHVKGGQGYDRYRYDQSIDRLRSVEARM